MVGGNIIGNAALFIFGHSRFGNTVGTFLTLVAIVAGILVLSSFIITRLIKIIIR